MVSLTDETVSPKAKVRMPFRPGNFTATLPALVLLVLFFVVPVLILLSRSVTEPVFGLGNYAALLGSSTYLKIFFNPSRCRRW